MNNEQSRKRPHNRGSLFSTISGFIKISAILLTLALVIAGGFLIGGFLKFTDTIASYELASKPADAAAIVVYTGGTSRIDEAVKLLKAGKGKRLLISGVNPKITQKTLRSKFHIDQFLLDCCIDIDKQAANTVGNAVETGKWSTKHNFNSLIIVTNNYHMPRSILETNRQLPGVMLTPHPVITDDLKMNTWYKDRHSLNLLFSEYSKYIASQIRPVLSENTIESIRSSMTSF